MRLRWHAEQRREREWIRAGRNQCSAHALNYLQHHYCDVKQQAVLSLGAQIWPQNTGFCACARSNNYCYLWSPGESGKKFSFLNERGILKTCSSSHMGVCLNRRTFCSFFVFVAGMKKGKGEISRKPSRSWLLVVFAPRLFTFNWSKDEKSSAKVLQRKSGRLLLMLLKSKWFRLENTKGRVWCNAAARDALHAQHKGK